VSRKSGGFGDPTPVSVTRRFSPRKTEAAADDGTTTDESSTNNSTDDTITNEGSAVYTTGTTLYINLEANGSDEVNNKNWRIVYLYVNNFRFAYAAEVGDSYNTQKLTKEFNVDQPYYIVATFWDQNTGVQDISLDNDLDAPAEYFNLQGVRVNPDNLAPGLYLVRKGNEVTKQTIK